MSCHLKEVTFFYLCIFKLSFLFAQDSLLEKPKTSLSISEAWKKATEYSKKIQLSEFEAEISKEEIREVRFERLPEIELEGNIEYATNLAVYENGLLEKPSQHEVVHLLYKIGTDMYFNIYNGNKLNLIIDKKKLLHEISEEQKDYTISQIKLQASAYYLSLQQSIIFRDLMIKDIAYQKKQLDEIKQLLKNGVVLKSDELRVELKLSNQKMILVKIENDIALANQKLNILIGQPDTLINHPTEEINPKKILLKSYEDCLHEAKKHSYEYNISGNKTELSKVHLKYTKANVRPKVGLYSDVYLANPQIFLFPYSPSNYTLGIFGVRASLPVSEIYLNKPKMTIARIEVEKEELEHHHVEDKIRQEVYEAYLRFQEAIIRIDVAKVNLDYATENARIISNNYFNQTSLITDLLDANVQLLQTQFEYASAQISAQLQYYQLLNILGTL